MEKANNKKIFTIYYMGTCGNFIMNIIAYYQQSKSYIDFDIDESTAHSHSKKTESELGAETVRKDHIVIGEFNNWWKDTGSHLHDYHHDLQSIREKYTDHRLLLIDFKIEDVDLITKMYWNKMFKKTLTRERYDYCRSLIHGGDTWADFDHWQDDAIACKHLFYMHKESCMPWLEKIDRSLIDLTLPFREILDGPDLNDTIAGWCGSQPDKFIDQYIERYRTKNQTVGKLLN